jgi:heterodisulfide reductase subunit D
LDYCCGDGILFLGEIEKGGMRAQELVATIASFQPEAAVLWCPTCHCRFEKTIVPAMDVPFKILSFPQYLAANMSKLPLTKSAAGTVTLHEACKSAYTGVDLNGPREVLRQLPGVTLREMKHHGQETVCCGSGAICWFPESCAQIRKERLQDAAQTGAGRLVTVCHYCNQTFAAEGGKYDFIVTNYVNLVAEAMGIRRNDKFTQYTLWGNPDLILKDAEDHIAKSPFENERIIEVLQAVFMG